MSKAHQLNKDNTTTPPKGKCKNCKPIAEQVTCPDCKRTNKHKLCNGNGYVPCRKCHQFILLEGFKPVKVVPKEFVV